MESRQTVGIDLGTTFSAIARVGEDGQARPILNAEGSVTTPSVAIWWESAFLVGQPALDLVYQAQGEERECLAASLVRGVKRMMGNPPEGGLTSNERTTTPVEVSAAILAKLARDATALLGFPVRDAVITVPAHFGDRERSATKLAAEMAGLNVLQMINEPSAAALAYTRGEAPAPGVALVFDLGGGTFDATVLELTSGPLTVLATQGIEELGGLKFTNNLATSLRRRYETETGATYPTDSVATDRLVVAAEAAKCALSDALTTTVRLEPPDAPAYGMEVTRAEFERQIKLYLLQLKTAVEIAVERSKRRPEEIDRVLLCGGSSRIPAVQQMLEQLFGKPPERTLDLDLSVALGAAYLAAHAEPAVAADTSRTTLPMPEIKPGILQDCIGNPVGIAMLDATGSRIVKVLLLHQGDALDIWSAPYRVRIATTSSDFPPIQVYQGENPDIEPRDFVGTITLSLPPDTPVGAHATVEMMQDQSGLVQVRLTVDGADLPGGLNRA